MQHLDSISIPIKNSADVLIARAKAMLFANHLFFKTADQVRVATAVSELARNMIQHAQGGICEIYDISSVQNIGIQIHFTDNGNGITDINLAMQDGYSTNGGLGLGLPGTFRLVDEMEVNSNTTGTSIKIQIIRKRPLSLNA